MKINILVEKEVEAKFLEVICLVRYWEDGVLNGNEDINGQMPCRKGNSWCPIIEIDTGKIVNWEIGNTGAIHYKVCDSGTYTLLDENKTIIKSIDGYVPKIMCPKEKGYGDYIIMDVNENGQISNWRTTGLEEFLSESEND